MGPEDRNGQDDVAFPDSIDPFIQACPGPTLAIKALRLVAYRAIKGISGLEPGDPAHSGPSKNRDGRQLAPMRTLSGVADAVFCTADHLSREARRYGYSISLAIRWVTFLQGYALREQGVGQTQIARRLGFSDASSWSRFVKHLTGKAPTQLPHMPLNDWVLEARRQVFLVPYR